MMEHYILEDQEIVLETDFIKWARWFESADRRVAKTTLQDCEISTVFLGLDHQWRDGPPLLFETMIFGGESDREHWQYPTWDDAMAGHRRIVELLEKEGDR